MRKFAEAGYHATTVADVVKEAGVAQGTLYLYFPSKQALFEAVMARVLEEFIAASQLPEAIAAMDAAAFEEAVVAAYRRSLALVLKHQRLLAILHTEMPREPACSDLMAHSARQAQAWARVLEAGARAGKVRAAARPEVIVQVWMGAVSGLVQAGLVAGPADVERVARELAELTLYGLIGKQSGKAEEGGSES